SARRATGGCVDDEIALAVADVVDDVRGSLADLVDRGDGDAHPGDRLRGAPRGDDPEPDVVKPGRELRGGRLVAVGDRDEDGALLRKGDPGRRLRLAERGREVAGDAHDLAGRLHL